MRSQGPYEIDDSPDRVDPDAVWQFLSAEAHWSRWRSRDDVQRQIQGAWRVVGCYDGKGHMVGFARALSDGVALAYLADVYVLENHRGRGLGRALLQEMIEDGPGKLSGGCCTPPTRTACTGNSASPPRTPRSWNAPAVGPRRLIGRGQGR
jgi:GNAT superfamily N-acetyltransferase